MSPFTGIILIILLLTALGVFVLAFITVKFYWGDRGKPPLTGEQRRKQKEEELKLRARQIEYSEKNSWKPRKTSFWDNSKDL